MRIFPKPFYIAALLIVCMSTARPASAYYPNFYGYGWGTSLLYPLASLPYSLLGYGLRGYGYGGGNPGYLLNNLVYQSAYAPFGYLPYGGRLGIGGNLWNQPYGNYGQSGYPQSGSNAQSQPQPYYNNNQYAYDQSYHRWPGNPSPAATPQATAFNDPISPFTVSGSPPPLAPERPGQYAVLADSFLKTVGTKYDGNISRALKNPEVYSSAQALQLVGDQKSLHLSESRKQAIAKVVKDNTLDAESKLATLKILMH